VGLHHLPETLRTLPIRFLLLRLSLESPPMAVWGIKLFQTISPLLRTLPKCCRYFQSNFLSRVCHSTHSQMGPSMEVSPYVKPIFNRSPVQLGDVTGLHGRAGQSFVLHATVIYSIVIPLEMEMYEYLILCSTTTHQRHIMDLSNSPHNRMSIWTIHCIHRTGAFPHSCKRWVSRCGGQ
jgi:hypothetical protein